MNLDDPTLLATAHQNPLGFIESLPKRVTLEEVQRSPGLLRLCREHDSSRWTR